MPSKEHLLQLISDLVAAQEPFALRTTQDGLAKIATAIDTVFTENHALRCIVSDCTAAIGNGAFCSPAASLEFMQKVPHEISANREAIANAVAPLRIVHDGILSGRQSYADATFIIFESELDPRLRFTFGQLSDIVTALDMRTSPELSHG